MANEADKTTRRMVSAESLTLQELTETRSEFRKFVEMAETLRYEAMVGCLPERRRKFFDALNAAKKFLGVLLVLIVPSSLFW